MSLNRRAFFAVAGRRLATVGTLVVVGSLAGRRVWAQGASQGGVSSTGGIDMPATSYKPVRRQRKPNAAPQLDEKAVEELERKLACPCPCTHDVYTCRTTDFSCAIAPAVHRDVLSLVEGGYSANEIMSAMTDTYGDYVLLTSRRRGFNLFAWFTPFAAIGIGAVMIAALLRSWRRDSETAEGDAESAARASSAVGSTGSDATAEELERLDAVIRDDSR